MGKGWAVSDPQIRALTKAGRSRHVFGMKLFSTVGKNESHRQFGGSEVHVEVCYKPKQ
jgi:hypothetical protein